MKLCVFGSVLMLAYWSLVAWHIQDLLSHSIGVMVR